MTHRPAPGVSRARIPHVGAAAFAILAAAAGLSGPPALAAQDSRGPVVPPGAVTSLVLPIKGMTCALCTRGVEQSIKVLDSVEEATAELSTGLVRVQAVEGKSLNIHDVRDRVVRAGFKVGGECDAVATGRFSLGPEGRITFRIPGTVYSFQVLEGAELKRLFKSSPQLRGDYMVQFRLHEHPRWKPPAISIVRAELKGALPRTPGR